MLFNPKTLKEAMECKYGRHDNVEYNPNKCAFKVHSRSVMMNNHQCRRNNGHGINNLYCKQHARKG